MIIIEGGELIIGANDLRIYTGILVIELHFLFFSENAVENTSSAQVSNK